MSWIDTDNDGVPDSYVGDELWDRNYNDDAKSIPPGYSIPIICLFIAITGFVMVSVIVRDDTIKMIAYVCLGIVLLIGILSMVSATRKDSSMTNSPIKPSNEYRAGHKTSEFIPYSGNRNSKNKDNDVPADGIPQADAPIGEIKTVRVTLQAVGDPAAYYFILDGKTAAVIGTDISEHKVRSGKRRVVITTRDAYRSVLFDSYITFDHSMGFTVDKKKMGYSVHRTDLQEEEPAVNNSEE